MLMIPPVPSASYFDEGLEISSMDSISSGLSVAYHVELSEPTYVVIESIEYRKFLKLVNPSLFSLKAEFEFISVLCCVYYQ